MKIFINEIQLDILYNLLTEEKYNSVAKSVKPGDELKIVDKNNNEILFSVILNDAGRLYLKSAIKNNIYSNDFFFKDLSDIDNNSMELKRVNTPSEFRNIDDDLERLNKVKTKYPINTWKTFTFKTIKQLYLNDIDIDLDDTQAQQPQDPDTQAQQPQDPYDNYTPVTNPSEINDLLADLKSLKEGSRYKFILANNGSIEMDLFQNIGGTLSFNVFKGSLKGSATNYTELENSQLRLDINAKNVKKFELLDDSGEATETYYDITFIKMIGGTGSGSEKPITVTKIIDINLQQKRNKKIPSPDEVEAMDSIDITKQVLDHPEMAAAFFKRGLFGTYKGVIPANKIIKRTLNKYFDSKKEYEKIKKIFKVGKLWTFNLSRNSVNFNNLELDMNKSYSVKVDKQPSKYGVETILLNGVEPTLINGKRTDIKYSIEIKGYDESTKEYITTIWVNGKSQDDIRMTLDKNF